MELDMQQLKVQVKKAEVTSMVAKVRDIRGAKNRTDSTSPDRGHIARKSSEDGGVSPTGSASGSLDDNKDRIATALRQHQQAQRGTSAGTSKTGWMNALSDIHEAAPESNSAPTSRAPSVAHARYRETQKRLLERRTNSGTAKGDEAAAAAPPDLTRPTSGARPKWS